MSKECRCLISDCNLVLDALFTCNYVFYNEKYDFARDFCTETLWAFFLHYSSVFDPKINLVISRSVTKLMVWMKPLTRLLTWKRNLQGYFIDIPKIEQCEIFFLVYQNWTMKFFCVIVGRLLRWWASWCPRPRIWQGILSNWITMTDISLLG